MKNPAAPVRLVLSAVCVLRNAGEHRRSLEDRGSPARVCRGQELWSLALLMMVITKLNRNVDVVVVDDDRTDTFLTTRLPQPA